MSKPTFSKKEDFIFYLENMVIPDLKQAGMCGTVEDFKEAIYWMESK